MSDQAPRSVLPVVSLLLLGGTMMFGCAAPPSSDSTGTAVSAIKSCTAEQGQALIDNGQYTAAIQELTCVIDAQPTEVEGYRGRIEAELLLGRFSDAVSDYTRVTARVLPVHPDAASTIISGYSARLADTPNDIPALTGASFARWWFFQYAQSIHLLDQLLVVRPNDVYGNLFRGSSRLLHGARQADGAADLERAIELAPESPHVHYVVADAYTYGNPDPNRAFDEASLALAGGLDTPRVHAILASSYLAFGNQVAAANHIQHHIELVTTNLVSTSPLAANSSQTLDLVPGRTYEIPIAATAGQTIEIATSSPQNEIWDTIAVLLGPDGSPIVGSDDANKYLAALCWNATATGTYRLQVTSFESVSTGGLVVKRD